MSDTESAKISNYRAESKTIEHASPSLGIERPIGGITSDEIDIWAIPIDGIAVGPIRDTRRGISGRLPMVGEVGRFHYIYHEIVAISHRWDLRGELEAIDATYPVDAIIVGDIDHAIE